MFEVYVQIILNDKNNITCITITKSHDISIKYKLKFFSVSITLKAACNQRIYFMHADMNLPIADMLILVIGIWLRCNATKMCVAEHKYFTKYQFIGGIL